MEGTSNLKLRITAVVRKASKRIIFVEAGRDFVDVFMGFLLLPVGSVVKLLSSVNLPPEGGISNVFDSVVKMQDYDLLVEKKVLADPKPSPAFQGSRFLQIEAPDYGIYTCNSDHRCRIYTVGRSDVTCPKHSGCSINRQMVDVTSRDCFQASSSGYVLKNVFTVTDELEIYPSLTILSQKHLDNKFQVKDIMADLEAVEIYVNREDVGEAEVEMDLPIVSLAQVLRLLRSSLTSKTVLNDVLGLLVADSLVAQMKSLEM